MKQHALKPPPRREWTAKYGAITLDSGFGQKHLFTSANTLYRDFESLRQWAGNQMNDICPDDDVVYYHAYHSGRRCDIVFERAWGVLEAYWWAESGLLPIQDWTQNDDLIVAEDAALRNVTGTIESQSLEAAYPAIERAIDLAPGRPELLQFANECVRVGKFSLAGRIIDQRLERDPEDVMALVLDAEITVALVNQGQWGGEHLGGAEERVATAVRKKPSYLRARILYCNIARLRGNLEGAVERFEEVLHDFPRCDVAHYNLAAIHLEGAPERALTHFSRGQELAPDDADYPLGRARALLALGRREEARAALDQGEHLDPNHRLVAQLRAKLS